jgi:hypothetical protein
VNTKEEIVSHFKAIVPAGLGKGQLIAWFEQEAQSVLAGLASSVDEPTAEAALKELWDTLVVPNDGIPDFLDAFLWSRIVSPLIKKAYANLADAQPTTAA